MHIVILTCPNCPPIHFEHIRRNNPYASVSVYYEEHWGDTKDHWRNADRMIRNWWLRNRDCFQHEDRFVILEYDVFVNDEIVWVEDGSDASAKNVHDSVETNWTWWSEVEKLPYEMNPKGISPLCCITMNRSALDSIADPFWDELFKEDIFCELRLASILEAQNKIIKPMKLPYVSHDSTEAHRKGYYGIFHAVKTPQPL